MYGVSFVYSTLTPYYFKIDGPHSGAFEFRCSGSQTHWSQLRAYVRICLHK